MTTTASDRFVPAHRPRDIRYRPSSFSRRQRPTQDITQAAPPVTLTQWLLALAAIVSAAAGSLSQSLTGAYIITLIVSGISLLLTAHAIRNTVRSGLLGQAVMLSALWVLISLEAVQSALGTPPFAVPQNFPGVQLQFDPEIIHRALLHLSLFQLALLVGYATGSGGYSLGRWLRSRTDVLKGGRTLQALLASSTVLALGSTYHWNWTPLSRALLGSYRVRMDEDAYLLTEAPLLYYLLPLGLYATAVLFVSALQARGFRRYVSAALAAPVAIFVLLLSTRHYMLVILVPVGAAALKLLYRRLSVPKLLLLALALLLVFCALQAQVAVRGLGWESLTELSFYQLLSTDVGSQFAALLFAESLVPQEHDFFWKEVPVHFITFWVPRRVWRDKPVDTAWEYFNKRLTKGSTTWNVTPTAVGQFYMSFGAIGVCAIAWCLGMLCRIADDLIAPLELSVQQAPVVFAATLYVFVINSLRYVAPFYVMYSVAAFIGVVILTRKTGRALSYCRSL